jgi:4-hydroxy-tetrahydrodipicolinate reductase
MIRVAVHGATGKMGAEVCRAVAGAEDLTLVAAIDPGTAGRHLGDVVEGLPGADLVAGMVASAAHGGAAQIPGELVVAGSLGEVDPGAIDVLVDFTRADAALTALQWCVGHGVHAVSGTTGISPDDLVVLDERFASDSSANCVLAPNFALTAVLLVRLAELCAPYLDSVEIIELHHDQKRDAPSGTALDTARRIADARSAAGLGAIGDPTTHEVLAGARGGVGEGGIHVHSVRLPGFVAHEEVIFGAPGQSLTIRQDSFDRISFMAGVLASVRKVASLPGLTMGLDAVLGL